MANDYGLGANPTDEIILAGGNLEYCLTGTGEVTAGTWTSVGYTAKDAGATLTDKPATFHDVNVTGLTDPVKRKPLDRQVQLKATLLQLRLENLAIAGGGLPTDVAGGVLKGGATVEPQELKWRYTVQNDDDPTKDKRLYIPHGKVTDAADIPFKDEAESGVALTISGYEVRGTEAPAVTYGGASLTGYRYLIAEGTF
jgi:hypothetical protein